MILFSHPEDYTPVCTTELAALAKDEPEFARRGVKLIGLSANSIESHGGWINDISEIAGCTLTFPVIGDKDRKIAYTYDMLVILSFFFLVFFYLPSPRQPQSMLGGNISPWHGLT